MASSLLTQRLAFSHASIRAIEAVIVDRVEFVDAGLWLRDAGWFRRLEIVVRARLN